MVTDESGWSGIRHGDWSDHAKIRSMLDAGADPDGVVWQFERPLHFAASNGSPEVVAELARRVADIDAEHNGRTALWNAVYHRRPENARVLVAAGADPWRPMMAGWSPGRLSLAGPTPFTVPEGEAALSAEESAVVGAAQRLTAVFDDVYLDGLGMACVAEISAAEAARRLGATSLSDASDLATEDYENDLAIVGATDVPGGCVIAQPGGFAPQTPDVMSPLTAGTVAYGLYANPKSGDQGSIFRDGAVEGWDLSPGGAPYPTATSREVLVGYLTQHNAIAFCFAYAGLRPEDARAVEGPPDRWLRLP
jgi:ankyrin repeat protein